ncbi:hypothetical protein [Streptomyces sp. NPDC092307]|uniref:hypothetical protein n=1 Tax=Streptomyces sp. NPDC092307 TaxID=3366013 RepID=UPI0037F5634E
MEELPKGPASHDWEDPRCTLARVKTVIGRRFHLCARLAAARGAGLAFEGRAGFSMTATAGQGLVVARLDSFALGGLPWTTPELPGSAHDPTAASASRIIDEVAEAGVKCWRNSTALETRCTGEQTRTTQASGRLLQKPRCSTNRISDIAKTAFGLHHTSVRG